jgi:hypothetical protein
MQICNHQIIDKWTKCFNSIFYKIIGINVYKNINYIYKHDYNINKYLINIIYTKIRYTSSNKQ